MKDSKYPVIAKHIANQRSNGIDRGMRQQFRFQKVFSLTPFLELWGATEMSPVLG